MYTAWSNSAVDPNGDKQLPTQREPRCIVALQNRDYIRAAPRAKSIKIGLPLVGKVFSPYVFTGPTFAFLASKKGISEAYENKSFDCAWNFGVGLQFFTHLQVSASYAVGSDKDREVYRQRYQRTAYRR